MQYNGNYSNKYGGDHIKTKDRLLEASHTLFIRDGYETTKVEDICLLADTAKGSFFYYFDKKETVVLELLNAQIKGMTTYLSKTLGNIPSPREQLSQLMSTLLYNRNAGPPALSYFKTLPLPLWFDTLTHQVRDMHMYPLILGIINEGVRIGEFNEACDEITVDLIYQGITHMIHKNYIKLNEPDYFNHTVKSIEYVLNTILGTNQSIIKLSEVSYEKTSKN